MKYLLRIKLFHIEAGHLQDLDDRTFISRARDISKLSEVEACSTLMLKDCLLSVRVVDCKLYFSLCTWLSHLI